MTTYDENRIVVVTGAASGIGRAICERFRDAGSVVVGIDKAIDPAADRDGLRVDLTIEAEIVEAFAAIASRYGRVDVLVNCAGIFIDEQPSSRFDPAQFDRIFSVNVKAMMLTTREAQPLFREGGRIINIASELAFLGRFDAPIYAASKGAIISLTRSWAREFAPRILVNAVAPGATDTPMLRWSELSPSAREQELNNPLKRLGKPREVAEAVFYLAAEWSGYITGQVLSVDGGAAMH